MAFQAEFAGGDPIRTEWTGASNTNAGDVIVTSNSNTAGGVGIATQPINTNAVGAIEIAGGIYRMNCAGNDAVGKKVYWDSVLKQVVNAVGVNTINLGFLAENSVVNTVTRVLHHPF
jgi:hypothetical protein